MTQEHETDKNNVDSWRRTKAKHLYKKLRERIHLCHLCHITLSKEPHQGDFDNKLPPLQPPSNTHTSMTLPPSLVRASVDACNLLCGKWQVRPVYLRGLKTHTSGFVCLLLWPWPTMTLLAGTIEQMESQAPGRSEGRHEKYFPPCFRVWRISPPIYTHKLQNIDYPQAFLKDNSCDHLTAPQTVISAVQEDQFCTGPQACYILLQRPERSFSQKTQMSLDDLTGAAHMGTC